MQNSMGNNRDQNNQNNNTYGNSSYNQNPQYSQGAMRQNALRRGFENDNLQNGTSQNSMNPNIGNYAGMNQGNNANNFMQNKKKIPVGLIIGIVAGAFAFMLVCIVVIVGIFSLNKGTRTPENNVITLATQSSKSKTTENDSQEQKASNVVNTRLCEWDNSFFVINKQL